MTSKTERYRLTTPCTSCPFRADKPFPLKYLRAKDIVNGLRQGSEFNCHKTTEETGNGKPTFCAGALIVLEKTEGPNQLMRIAESLDLYKPGTLDKRAPVYDSFDAFIEGVSRQFGDWPFEEDEEGSPTVDYCGIADGGCDNPQAFGGGGTIIESEELPECTAECNNCGHFMCESCTHSPGLCAMCAPEDEDDEAL